MLFTARPAEPCTTAIDKPVEVQAITQMMMDRFAPGNIKLTWDEKEYKAWTGNRHMVALADKMKISEEGIQSVCPRMPGRIQVDLGRSVLTKMMRPCALAEMAVTFGLQHKGSRNPPEEYLQYIPDRSVRPDWPSHRWNTITGSGSQGDFQFRDEYEGMTVSNDPNKKQDDYLTIKNAVGPREISIAHAQVIDNSKPDSTVKVRIPSLPPPRLWPA